jgi:hypothetical protein
MAERWAAVEIMGHRKHVGRISEEPFAGAMMLRVEALNRDGSFEVIRYGGGSISALHEIEEEKARRAAVPRWSWACGHDSFQEPSAYPGACATCGWTREEHEAIGAKALPPPEDDDLIDEDPPESQDEDLEEVDAHA